MERGCFVLNCTCTADKRQVSNLKRLTSYNATYHSILKIGQITIWFLLQMLWMHPKGLGLGLGLAFITFAKFSWFCTPFPACVYNTHASYKYYCLLLGEPPLPQCAGHKWKPPNLNWANVIRVSHWANVFFFSALLHRPRKAAGYTVQQCTACHAALHGLLHCVACVARLKRRKH